MGGIGKLKERRRRRERDRDHVKGQGHCVKGMEAMIRA